MIEQTLHQSPPSLTRAVLNFLSTSFKESLGYPASLHELLRVHPKIAVRFPEQDPCIALEAVVRWQLLGSQGAEAWPHREQGSLLGWAAYGSSYHSFFMVREEYARLVRKEVVKDWCCDISDVHGFSGSKSNLLKFHHTDEMVEADSRGLIEEISRENLDRNLAHSGIRIIHKPDGTDYFVRHNWDGRVYLANGDGSHHLAAAKYIAAKLGMRYMLQSDLHQYSINDEAVTSLRNDFEMFVISDTPAVANGFHDAMESFRATWYWHGMPRPYEDTRAILLPRSDKRSMRVAAVLRKAGVLDFGAYLSRMAVR